MNAARKGVFPIEIMLSIFCHLDGPMLCVCKQVCQGWRNAIDHYDDMIWPFACSKLASHQRFNALQFPRPVFHRTHQDMYRIAMNWYRGHCEAYYPSITNKHKSAQVIIGTVQEQGMFTTLTIAKEGIIRSNPNYHTSTGAQRLVVQSPQTKSRYFLEESHWIHENNNQRTIVCHYSHPNSKYLVTGSLNGVVSVWDLEQKKLIRVWQGHRGRVLCVCMNDKVVVSGGSDNIIRVWDLDDEQALSDNGSDWVYRRTRRGMIEVSKYLSSETWYQGIGEIAVNGSLIACAPDGSSGPILVFSLLTGSRVYELKEKQEEVSEWMEQSGGLSRICLTPFFLLTKGKVVNDHHQSIRLVPSHHNVVLQRTNKKKTEQSIGYVSRLSDSQIQLPNTSQMTPYQLYRYYNNNNNNNSTTTSDKETKPIPPTSGCINVWDLKTGKILYRLVPTLEQAHQYYTITDIKVSPDYSKVFCTIDVREENKEYLYCWDFAIHHRNQTEENEMGFTQVDYPDSNTRTCGASFVCFM